MHTIQLRFSSAVSRTTAVRSLFSVILFVLMSPFSIAALDVDNFSAATNDRFDNDPAFIGDPYDWSGVGKATAANGNINRWVTMIDENIFLSAAHFPPATGGTTYFYQDNDPAATPITRTVAGGMAICGSDLYIGHLDFAVGANINKYDYLTTLIPNTATYNATIANDFVFQTGVSPTTTGYGASGQTNMTVGENHAESFLFNQTFPGLPGSGDFIVTVNNEPGDAGFTYETHDSNVNVGDSGSPLMFPDANGDLVLYGVAGVQLTVTVNGVQRIGSAYTYVAQDASCLTEISNYIDANINAVVPEPNSAVLLLVGFVLMIRRRNGAV